MIILREMDQREINILFEHTNRLRMKAKQTRLLVQDRLDREENPEYAWVRRRAKSSQKSPMKPSN